MDLLLRDEKGTYMTIQVTGVLPDPMGNPMRDAIIRVTALESDYTPPGSEASQTVSRDGNYSFSLEEGSYRIEIHQDDEYTEGTDVLVPSGLTGSFALPQLMADYKITE
ncbi:hypothetical protein VPHD292_0017 [Vibrio phage D292]